MYLNACNKTLMAISIWIKQLYLKLGNDLKQRSVGQGEGWASYLTFLPPTVFSKLLILHQEFQMYVWKDNYVS